MSMKKLFLCTVAIAAAVATFGATAAEAAPLPKITICHFPPGNPANVQTITISQNAWPAHEVLHGDVLGPCDVVCNDPCDDGDACTSDECDDATGACVNEPISCSDNLNCTVDSCDSVNGCSNEPVACPPPTECTTFMCREDQNGACVETPVADGTPCGGGFCIGGVCETQ